MVHNFCVVILEVWPDYQNLPKIGNFSKEFYSWATIICLKRVFFQNDHYSNCCFRKKSKQFVKSIQHVAMKKLEENMIWQLLGLFDLGLGLHLLTNLVAQFLHYTKKRQINLFSFLLTHFIDFIWISFWIKIWKQLMR